jgi:two-component system OmpR family response regulator
MPDRLPAAAATQNKSVLVVVAESAIRELLAISLRRSGLFPLLAASREEGHRFASEVRPDAMLIDLDLMDDVSALSCSLAGGDAQPPVPTFLLTSPARQQSTLPHVTGDVHCVLKPFAPRDLVEQIVGSLRPRRAPPARRKATQVLRVGEFQLLLDRQSVCYADSEEISLPPVELRLLQCLMTHSDQTLSREEIACCVWGEDSGFGERAVDQCVKRLRAHLDQIGAGECVKTVRGFGYRIGA